MRTSELDFGVLSDDTLALKFELELPTGAIKERDLIIMREGNLVSLVRLTGPRPSNKELLDTVVRVAMRRPRPAGRGRQRSRLTGARQRASSPRSPVRMRTTSSTGVTQILPSPILPVRAASRGPRRPSRRRSSGTSDLDLHLGHEVDPYSAPR